MGGNPLHQLLGLVQAACEVEDKEHHLQKVEDLLRRGIVRVDARDADHEEPGSINALRLATDAENVALIRLLLRHGACPNQRFDNTSTPLMMSAQYGSAVACEAFLAAR